MSPSRWRRFWPRKYVALAAVLLGGLSAYASPPLIPLPLPGYSFDRLSPAVMAGDVAAGDVLTLLPTQVTTDVPAAALGLFSMEDDIDGLSNSGFNFPGPFMSFALLFSVDRATVGIQPPDPNLVAAGVPFNVVDQAARGHAAGDEFITLAIFVRMGLGGPSGGRPASNNASVRNNFNEGGTDFGAAPPTHSYDNVPGVPQDNVDGLAEEERESTRGPVIHLYFTLRRGSPALYTLPGNQQPSGAHIFYNPRPGDQLTELYAPFQAFGLVQADDVDALIVYDPNGVGVRGVFDAMDFVLFSLDPASPSLWTIPGASPQGAAADIFIARPNQPAQVFAPANALGLGASQDNVDALDWLLCANGHECALRHGIRLIPSDCNCDGRVDLADMACCMAGPDHAVVPELLPCFGLDSDGDHDVDLRDFVAFQIAVGDP